MRDGGEGGGKGRGKEREVLGSTHRGRLQVSTERSELKSTFPLEG